MKVFFGQESSILREILFNDSESLAASLDVIGRPLVIHNLERLGEAYGRLEEVQIPPGYPKTASLIQEALPDANLREGEGDGPGEGTTSLSLDSLVLKGPGGLRFERLTYPWDLLRVLQDLLSSEVTTKFIAEDAAVSDTAVVAGPCHIGAGASIDDFCKVRGPIYIAAGTKVGTGSLVRNASIGANSEVGFNSEVSKSFLIGQDVVPHLDLILDTVLSQDIWMGGYVGTINALFTHRNVRCLVDGQLVDSGLIHLGALAGHGVRIGAACMTLPGRYLPPGTVTQVNSVFSESGDIVRSDRHLQPPSAPSK